MSSEELHDEDRPLSRRDYKGDSPFWKAYLRLWYGDKLGYVPPNYHERPSLTQLRAAMNRNDLREVVEEAINGSSSEIIRHGIKQLDDGLVPDEIHTFNVSIIAQFRKTSEGLRAKAEAIVKQAELCFNKLLAEADELDVRANVLVRAIEENIRAERQAAAKLHPKDA